MPPSDLQAQIIKLIASNRHPGSIIAGGVALNQHGFRHTNDIDIFQHSEASLLAAFTADRAILILNGYDVQVSRSFPTLISARVSLGSQETEVDWAMDSSFSFFPPMTDPQLGYKLHPFDLATNKALAAAARREARDIIDLINLDKNYLGLGAIVWAAVAKDPGFSPALLIEHISRNSAHSDEEYELLDQTDPINAKEAKAYLLDALNRARDFIDIAPPDTLGHAFLDSKGRPRQPAPNEFGAYTLHTASVGGVWPSIPEMDSRLIHESSPDTSEPSGPP